MLSCADKGMKQLDLALHFVPVKWCNSVFDIRVGDIAFVLRWLVKELMLLDCFA